MIFKKIAIWIRNYFGFSKTETRGLVVLMPLTLCLIISYAIINDRLFYNEESIEDNTGYLDSLSKLLNQNLSEFNQIQTPIRQPIKSTQSYPQKQKKKIAEQNVKRDINSSDTLGLRKVYGVGSVLSKRIVKFRNALGGFVEMDQLYEVYGLDSSVIDRIISKFYINDIYIPFQINLNSSTLENLAKHPYLSFDEARLIISYRSQHGSYKDLQTLLEIPVMDEIKIRKLRPYFLID